MGLVRPSRSRGPCADAQKSVVHIHAEPEFRPNSALLHGGDHLPAASADVTTGGKVYFACVTGMPISGGSVGTL
jgi:hypothetical protein